MVYDDDTTVADEAAWALHEAFEDAGINVNEALRIHDDHWYAVLPGAPLAAYQGVRFERSDHRFTAQGVFDGRVTHASREALRDTLLPDPAAVAVTRSLLDAADEVPVGGLRDLVQDHLTTATTFSDAELAAVAVTVTSGPRRDEVWAWLDRARGPGPSTSGPTPYGAFPTPTWRPRPRCWRSRPGLPGTGPWRGARSTAAVTPSHDTPSPTWSPSCWSPRRRRRRGRPLRPQLDGATDPAA